MSKLGTGPMRYYCGYDGMEEDRDGNYIEAEEYDSLARLASSLLDYVYHAGDCVTQTDYWTPCDCGLAELIKELCK